MPINNPASFRAEARSHLVCAVCDKPSPFHAHHVVDKQTLRRHGVPKNKLHDTRNAMRLCEGLSTARCHFQFENSRIRIGTCKLTDDNIEYAFEVLGAYAYDYLRREYDDSIPDERLAWALSATLEAA